MEGLTKEKHNRKIISWLKRIGWLGFLFFTIKGLIWLAIFMGLGKILGL
jgi:hypothetical protein